MLDIFKDYLFTHAVKEGKTVVLIIDEAQTLKPALIELLRQLINFETNDMKLLQSVLLPKKNYEILSLNQVAQLSQPYC